MSSDGHQKASDLVAARKAVRLVWDEVRRYGGTSVDVEVSSERVAYRFLARDGRHGEGSVNARYAVAMLEALRECGRMTLGCDAVEVLTSGPDIYRLALERGILVQGLERGPEKEAAAPASAQVLSLIRPGTENAPANPAAASRDMRLESECTANLSKVLIVEDNPTFARVLSRFLERQGFDVIVCVDGREALDKLDAGLSPELIVSDLHMPNLSGDEFTVLIRQRPALQAVPLILLTSDRSVEIELRALDIGADLFLAKNEDPRLIAAYAKRLVSRSRERLAPTLDSPPSETRAA